MPRHLLSIVGLVMLLLSLAPPAGAQANERCFSETGYCISGPIRTYWERNGGLAVFGYPISRQRTEVVEESWTGPVQWFERDRLEDHSNERKGVFAGRLGARVLGLRGRPWQTFPPAPGPGATNQCRFFSETGHILCGRFRAYWERNGGLERFGYPITEVFNETVEGRSYAVQYFERRRMEYHPKHEDTPYEVLLGLLGRDVFAVEGDQAVVQPTPGDLESAVQQQILDTAYDALRKSYPRPRLAIGLIDTAGDFAAAKATPFGQRPIFVYLAKRADTWQVVEATSIPSAEILRRRGIPEQLWATTDASTIIDLVLAQLQDPRGQGLDAYVTRPRVVGNFARLWVAPSLNAQRDAATMFFKREGGTWRFLTAGTAFPEDQLSEMGVPRELWPYGEGVRGPDR